MPPGNQFSAGAAVSYGWDKFTKNVGPLLIAMLVFLIIGGVLYFIQSLLRPDTPGSNGFGLVSTGNVWASLLSLIVGVIIFVWNYITEAALARAGLAVTEGRPVVLGELLTTDKLVRIILGGIVLAVLTVVGLILCVLPGLLVIFFGSFYMYFILDQDLTAWKSIEASFNFVKSHFGELLLLLILTWLITFVGLLLCGVGLLVAIPVVAIAKAYAYKRLTGQPVAA